MSYPIKINGYIYSPKTKQGFLRMQRQGIPRPIFSIQDKLARILNKKYNELVKKLLSDIRSKLKANSLVMDSWEDEQEFLQRYFEDLQKKQAEEAQKISQRANMMSLANQLENEWFKYQQDTIDEYYNPEEIEQDLGLDIIDQLNKIFTQNQKSYLSRLLSDADRNLNGRIDSFSIDKKDFFNRHLEAVKKRYINNSLQRLEGETNEIKRGILTRINDYALGLTDDLTLDDITTKAFNDGKHLSRLFARDQIQRFNKACTLATFEAAGVSKVRWATCNDGRVRNKGYTDKHGVYHRPHTELQGQVFDIDNLPLEIDDYNCRCGLVPVAYND